MTRLTLRRFAIILVLSALTNGCGGSSDSTPTSSSPVPAAPTGVPADVESNRAVQEITLTVVVNIAGTWVGTLAPSGRAAVAISQFCDRNSVAPRLPPRWLKVPNKTPSHATVQEFEDGGGCVSA